MKPLNLSSCQKCYITVLRSLQFNTMSNIILEENIKANDLDLKAVT